MFALLCSVFLTLGWEEGEWRTSRSTYRTPALGDTTAKATAQFPKEKIPQEMVKSTTTIQKGKENIRALLSQVMEEQTIP